MKLAQGASDGDTTIFVSCHGQQSTAASDPHLTTQCQLWGVPKVLMDMGLQILGNGEILEAGHRPAKPAGHRPA